MMLITMIEDRQRLGKRAGDFMKQNVASGTFANTKQGFLGCLTEAVQRIILRPYTGILSQFFSSSSHLEFSCRPPLASRFV
jgi:hypothetical protein